MRSNIMKSSSSAPLISAAHGEFATHFAKAGLRFQQSLPRRLQPADHFRAHALEELISKWRIGLAVLAQDRAVKEDRARVRQRTRGALPLIGLEQPGTSPALRPIRPCRRPPAARLIATRLRAARCRVRSGKSGSRSR